MYTCMDSFDRKLKRITLLNKYLIVGWTDMFLHIVGAETRGKSSAIGTLNLALTY